MTWADDLGPATAAVLCGDVEHRVRYEPGGRLALLDHADVEAEHALVALGGETAGCVLLDTAWQRLRSSPELLHRWSPVDPPWSELVRAEPAPSMFWRADAGRARPFTPWLPSVAAGGVVGAFGELLRVNTMPGPLRERLGLLVLEHTFQLPAATWVEGTTLAATLRRVACRFLRVAARHTAPDRRTVVVDALEGDPDEAAVMGHADGLGTRMTVWIGTDWLREVLRRAAAVVDGLLCTAAREVPGEEDGLDVQLVRWTWGPNLPPGELEPVCGWARAHGSPAVGWEIERWIDEQAGA